MITIGPGDEFFETFGHSAIRVKDPMLKMDYVFNYGVFDFNQPNFYANFAKGRLLYQVVVRPFGYFIKDYKENKRWMKEQVLDLTQKEKQDFFAFLRNNILPQNASYQYDPYFNNCSTKLRDIIKKVLGDKAQFSTEYVKQGLTLRQLMNNDLPWNTWGSFGINLALGSKLDKVMTADEYMYIPDYVYLALKDAKKQEESTSGDLVKKENVILNYEERSFQIKWYNPTFIFSLLLLITIVVTYRDQKRNRQSKWLDFSLFFISGILGLLIVFLWFFTDHSTTPNNFNFLWAFAPNLFVAFIFFKNKAPRWLPIYLKVCLILLLLTPIVWIAGIQLLSLAILPILGALLVRYYFINKLLSSKK
jgi:hypothetical protein